MGSIPTRLHSYNYCQRWVKFRNVALAIKSFGDSQKLWKKMELLLSVDIKSWQTTTPLIAFSIFTFRFSKVGLVFYYGGQKLTVDKFRSQRLRLLRFASFTFGFSKDGFVFHLLVSFFLSPLLRLLPLVSFYPDFYCDLLLARGKVNSHEMLNVK